MSDQSGGSDPKVGDPGFAPAMQEETEQSDPDASDEGEGVFGEAAPATAIEPGTPSLENAAFVVLGVASMVGLILHFASLLG